MKKIILLSLLTSAFLMGCASPETPEGTSSSSASQVQNLGAKLLLSVAELPSCDAKQVGQLFYVLASQQFQICGTNGYEPLDLSGQSGADGSSCSAKSTVTGIEISCAGIVIGVLANGTDGLPGQDGRDGTSCQGKSVMGGIEISCDGMILDTLTPGTNGDDGVDGIHCAANTIAEGVQVVCGGVPVDTVFNGQSGTSCTATVNGTAIDIKCDGTLVGSLYSGINGDKGDVGSKGNDGLDGVNGTSCTATAVTSSINGSTKTGFEVTCNNVLIDTLWNGLDGSNGIDGVDGKGFNFLGNKSARPLNPAKNDMFYWTTAGVTCLFDGSNWKVFSRSDSHSNNDCDDHGETLVEYAAMYDTLYWRQFGTQIWEVRNHRDRWAATYDQCYEDVVNGCTETSGRWYTWYQARRNPGIDTLIAPTSSDWGACPQGWHIPSWEEWITLLEVADEFNGDPSGNPAISMRVGNAYYTWDLSHQKGIDFGFNAYAVGYSLDTSWVGEDLSTVFWTSSHSQNSSPIAAMINSHALSDGVIQQTVDGMPNYKASVRCVADVVNN